MMKIRPVLASSATLALVSFATADTYDNVWIETNYISQCSASAANTTAAGIPNTRPGYGAINDWRIGNGAADFVDCGTQGIGSVGMMVGYNRLVGAGRSNSTLDSHVKTALGAFFNYWVTNTSNQILVNGKVAFPNSAAYDTAGNFTSKGSASPSQTAQILIAMRRYCIASPNGDRSSYQSQKYALAHSMADYINANLGSWTIDRSYAVAAFHGFANWASAVGDSGTATYFNNQANTISGWLAGAQDTGTWKNYYSYLDGNGNGVYNGNNVDQTGFAPYEFSARPGSEPYAAQLAQWWDYGTAYNGINLTVQNGTYSGGVHQGVPTLQTKAYPGSCFQLADAEWKIAHANGNLNNQYAQAWWHYNAAMSTLGSTSGLGCWVNNGSVDGFVGGFVDWVDSSGNRPATWQRFVDTSAYMIIATEELAFSNEVNWGA